MYKSARECDESIALGSIHACVCLCARMKAALMLTPAALIYARACAHSND